MVSEVFSSGLIAELSEVVKVLKEFEGCGNCSFLIESFLKSHSQLYRANFIPTSVSIDAKDKTGDLFKTFLTNLVGTI